MTVRRSLHCVLIALLLAGCGKQETGQPSESAISGTFELVADETLKPAIDSLVNGFMAENNQAHVTVKYVNAAEAVRELLSKQVRAIIIDRGLTARERGVVTRDSISLPALSIAEDGIGCIVSDKNPLAAIRLSDLRRMLRGELKSWQELDKPVVEPGSSLPGSITKVFSEYPSSGEYLLDSLLLGPDQQSSGALRRFSTSDSVIEAVGKDAGAIGFIGSGWKHWSETSGKTGVKVLPVIPADSSSHGLTEPVLLHIAYIYEGLYPLVTPVNGYTFEALNTVPRGLLTYAMTAHGQTVFKNFEILPKTQIIRIVPPKP